MKGVFSLSFIFGIHRSPVIGEMNTFEKGDLLACIYRERRRRLIELPRERVGKEIFWEKDAVRPASIVKPGLSLIEISLFLSLLVVAVFKRETDLYGVPFQKHTHSLTHTRTHETH